MVPEVEPASIARAVDISKLCRDCRYYIHGCEVSERLAHLHIGHTVHVAAVPLGHAAHPCATCHVLCVTCHM